MNKERYDQIIDEVYQNYLENHHEEFFIMADEMDLTREEFIDKAKTSHGFGALFGINIKEIEMTFEEKLQWVMRHTDVELENLAITERAYDPTTPTKRISLTYKKETIEIYE
jgi:hypothetical protein